MPKRLHLAGQVGGVVLPAFPVEQRRRALSGAGAIIPGAARKTFFSQIVMDRAVMARQMRAGHACRLVQIEILALVEGEGDTAKRGAGGAIAGTLLTAGNDGNSYGGGGSGGWFNTSFKGPGGGAGAYSTKTYTLGDLTVGASISLVVGAGGAGGSATYAGGDGADGGIYIEWS